MRLRFYTWLLCTTAMLVMFSSCRCSSKSGNSIVDATDPLSKLKARGKVVYLSNCIACHSTNPSAAGSQGPAVAGSSRDLLAAKILRGVYPEGYKPKRTSGAMPMLPHLEPDLDALEAYLNE
jgi:mono/diheme cytochrome c family protein